jgi:maltooligosyltrehalose trehalohydrolase
MPQVWKPSLGALVGPHGTEFRVWAPVSHRVDVVVDRPDGTTAHELARSSDGTFTTVLQNVSAGDRYRYRLDEGNLLPDPASRFQPDGVHGPSQVVDPHVFRWTDDRWQGLDRNDLVLYELHVGTFTARGTFDGVTERIPDLAALGVSAIELMPVADFPGGRNWGYDGVAPFAPARCYGTPDDLRSLVDAAHAAGIGVLLDVVYNHLGPDGAYLSSYSPYYFTHRHHTPWGAGLNFDGEHSSHVREFFIENALHWIHEYHIDGLRLDATHAIADDGPRHFLAELTTRVHESGGSRRPIVIAEDHRNLNTLLKPVSGGGWGIDAVWADDFHHQCRRLLAGDHEGYYRDFTGRTDDLATTVRRGWFFTGQYSQHLGERRGSDPEGLPYSCFVICLQNHDQVGNRALGNRLHHQIDRAAFHAASALLLMAPETPLIFMGQEWASSSPFLFFTDHRAELGTLVTKGRREEFRHFSAFSDPESRARIPDPQQMSTFLSSQLTWDERRCELHASTLRLYHALVALRRESTLRNGRACEVLALDDGTVALRRDGRHATWLVIVRLKGAGMVEMGLPAIGETTSEPRVILTTEDPRFASDPVMPTIRASAHSLSIQFQRPGAVILRQSNPVDVR